MLVGGTEYGRGRTMRETPFMAPVAPGPGPGPGPRDPHRVYPADGHAPGLSPGRRLRGAVPDRRRPGAGFSGGRGRGAAHHRHPPRAASPKWCGMTLTACCSGNRTMPPNWRRRSPASWTMPRSDNAWANRAGSGSRADFSWEKIARTLEDFYDEVMEQNRHGQYLATPKG